MLEEEICVSNITSFNNVVRFSLKQNLKNNAIIVNLGNGAAVSTPVSTTSISHSLV